MQRPHLARHYVRIDCYDNTTEWKVEPLIMITSTYEWFAVISALTLVYWIGYVFYQLFLSPLASVPGPKLAAISNLYVMYYDLVENARLPWKLQKLHAQYGPIVRLAPNEVHINDPQYLEDHFNSSDVSKRQRYEPYKEMFGMPQSTLNTVNPHLHKIRRAALAPYFSKRSVLKLEPMLAGKVEKVCNRLSQARDAKAPIDLRLLFSCMTTDIVTDYAFPDCFNLLDTEDLAPSWRRTFVKALRSFRWFKHFPWLWKIVRAIPDDLLLKLAPDMTVTKEWENGNQKLVQQVIDNFDPSQKEAGEYPTLFHELLASSLPPQEKEFERLWQEGSALIGAGVETASNVLNCTLFHLSQNPKVLARLQEELNAAMPNGDLVPWSQLETFKYLSAVISEGLRFAIGSITRFIRVCPDQPVVYREFVFPPGTAVSMSSLLIHHHPTTFPEPEKFDPNRWLSGQNHRAQLMTFGKGPHMCAGINLAYAELYMTLAAVVRRFDLTLYETTIADVEPFCDAFLPMPIEETQGVRVTVTDSKDMQSREISEK